MAAPRLVVLHSLAVVLAFGAASTSNAEDAPWRTSTPTFRATPAAQALAAPGEESVGHASWIGGAADGRMTASGERFDMFRLTAASADLPLGAYVSVANAETGEAALVRIIDRKPTDGDVLTLTQAAAFRIGLDQSQSARVVVRFASEAAADGSLKVALR